MPNVPADQLTDAELKLEQPRVIRNSVAALLFCSSILAGAYLVLPRYFEFPVDLSARIAFAFRADVFVFLWIIVGVRMVARGRFSSAADNRGSAFAPPSRAIAVPVAFLQNTLEQVVAAVGAHLALATLLEGAALSLIPAAVVLFGIGRLAFLIGYPKGAGARAFGMVTTTLPTIGGYGLAIWLTIARWM